MNYIIILLLVFFNFIFINNLSSAAFLENLDEYRGIKEYIIEKPYKEYKNSVMQSTIDDSFSQGTEDINSGSQVKVKTIFDFYSDKRAEKIESIKNTLIENIKNKEFIKTGYDPIDSMINKLEKPGKYFVIKADGDIIPINEDLVLYLYDYKIIGKEELINQVKNQILNLNTLVKQEKTSLDESNENLKKIIKTLDNYKIKYKRIEKSIDGSFYIGKRNGLKIEGKETFFINKIFTTPELKENLEKNDNKSIYFWTFITDEELNTKYYTENNGNGYDVFVKLLGDPMFVGNIKADNRIYKASLYPSKKDIFIYNIEKNKYEYIIMFILFLFGIVFGIYLTFNFINNFKNNFKKTPEEL